MPEMTVAERFADELWVCQLGTIPYRQGLELQARVREARQAGELPDMLLLLEHPPVYTRGRRSLEGELPLGEDFYRAEGIEVIDTDRGGRLTYHGPGQLVGYPIMAVDDVGRFLRTMESAIIAALAEEGLEARSRPQDGPDYTGVWVGERKIASIGLHVARGISTHGFAVNVENSLEPFSWVVACGLPDVSMTSLALETGAIGASLPCFRKRAAHNFCRAHGRRQRLTWPARLGLGTTHAAGLAAERAPIKTVPPAPAEAVPA
jgi:lipoyl(octanoyl) transferase